MLVKILINDDVPLTLPEINILCLMSYDAALTSATMVAGSLLLYPTRVGPRILARLLSDILFSRHSATRLSRGSGPFLYSLLPK